MSHILPLYFDDFKKVIKNHRLYYYEGENYFDFHFIVDGIFVKTTLLKSEIDNTEKFFSDPIFYNSIKLVFRIPDPKPSMFEIEGVRQPMEAPLSTVDEEQPEEVVNDDIQRSGVDDDGNVYSR